MDDLLLVDVVEALADFADDGTAVGLLHAVGLPEGLQQLSVGAELDQQVDVVLVCEVPVEGGHVAVRQVELDRQFPRHLVLVLLLPDLLLAHHLQSAQETRRLVLHQHHFSELAFTHLLPDREVALLELFGSGLLRVAAHVTWHPFVLHAY